MTMHKTHLFVIDGHRVIINEECSSIGYCYPRVFIEKDVDNHVNLDLTLGAYFKQKLSEFESWLDGTECRYDDISAFNDVCAGCGLNSDPLIALVRDIISK